MKDNKKSTWKDREILYRHYDSHNGNHYDSYEVRCDKENDI